MSAARRGVVSVLGLTMVVASCAGSTIDRGATPSTEASTTTVATTNPASTTTGPTTTAPTTTATPTSTTSTSTTTADPVLQRVELGRSVEGRPLVAVERGRRGGRVVLVIGCIHGDEGAGVAVTDDLLTQSIPAGIDLWVVPTMNPDGQAHDMRTNAHRVDLNRNFPYRWAPLGVPGDSQYAGTSAASEPETAAIVTLIERVKPELTVWYHQDLNRIAPATGRAGRIRQRYADLTGLPVLPVTGGTYTGTASPWAQSTGSGVAFIVELGPTLSDRGASTHADAVLELATELGSV